MSQDPQVQEIVVRDIRMRFGSMVVFMVKWAIAAIPALLILCFLAVAITVFAWGVVGSLTNALVHRTADEGGLREQGIVRVPLGKALKDQNPTDGKDLRVTDWKWSYDEHGARLITGTVLNNGHKPYTYAHVEFDLYDQNGAKVGEASGNTSDLAPGATWTFEAIVLEDKARAARLTGATGYR